MKRLLVLVLLTLCSFSAVAKTPQQRAKALVTEHDRNIQIWQAKVDKAATEQALAQLMEVRPKTKLYADAVLKAINPYLREDWTVEHMAWLIRNHPNLILKGADSNAGHKNDIDREDIFMRYFEKLHIHSSKAGEFVLSLTFKVNPNPTVEIKKMKLAETVVKKHKDLKNVGLASLAQAILLPDNKDDPKLHDRRMAMYKTAIVHASAVKIGTTSVEKIIRERLYHINTIGVGCPVPFIEGMDSSGLKHQISDNKGRVIMLVFWTQAQPNSKAIAARMKALIKSNENKEFALIGITADKVASIRELRANRDINWRNFIDTKGDIHRAFRINQMPYCYIIDRRGFIRHKGAFGGIMDVSVLAGVIADKK